MRATTSLTRASTSSTSAASTPHCTTRSSPWTNTRTAPLTQSQSSTPSKSRRWCQTLVARPSRTGLKACSYPQQTPTSPMAPRTRLASAATAPTAARSRGTPSCHSCATGGKGRSSSRLTSMTQRTRPRQGGTSACAPSLTSSATARRRRCSLASMGPWPPRNRTFISSRSPSTRPEYSERRQGAGARCTRVRRPHR